MNQLCRLTLRFVEITQVQMLKVFEKGPVTDEVDFFKLFLLMRFVDMFLFRKSIKSKSLDNKRRIHESIVYPL